MQHRRTGRHRLGVLNHDGRTIGLDIGATAVRAAVLEPSDVDGTPTVTQRGGATVALPPGVVVDGVVHDADALTSALKRLWHDHQLGGRQVILGIANPQVLVRSMTIPDLDQDQRAQALPFLAREVVALPMDQVVLDFCQLGPADPETTKVSGLLLATPRGPVLDAVRAVERAGLRVARVDLSSFGCLRSIADPRSTVEALVDMGAHLTTVVIHDHGVPRLVRTLARGGQELTDALADRLDLSQAEAEAAKRELGLAHPGTDLGRTLADALRPLFAEIRTSVQYYRSSSASSDGPSDDRAITRMSLTGGGALLHGIASALEEQTRLPTQVVDPRQHVLPGSPVRGRRRRATDETSAVALGLAMGAAA